MFDLPSGIVNLITGAGGALVVLAIGMYLFLAGKLHTDKTLQREISRADEWRTLYGEERDAHQTDREALAVANDRAEAAVENARVTKMLLEEIRARWDNPRRGHAVETE